MLCYGIDVVEVHQLLCCCAVCTTHYHPLHNVISIMLVMAMGAGLMKSKFRSLRLL